MEHLFRDTDGNEIERRYRVRAPESITVKGVKYAHAGMLAPSLAPSVGRTGRRGHDGYFTAHSLPRDVGNSMGLYDRVDAKGRPQFASRSERERALTNLNRIGYDYQYNEKPEVNVEKESTDIARPHKALRNKLGKLEAAGQKDVWESTTTTSSEAE